MSEETTAYAEENTVAASTKEGPKTPFQQSVMGHKVIVMVPATLAGLCAWAGGEEVVYKAALKNILYHGFSPNVRAGVAELLEERTGQARKQQVDDAGNPKTKKVKETDDNGNEVESEEPVLETEQDFLNWLIADGHVTPADVTAIMQEVADKTDAKPNKAVGRKPTSKSVEAAAKFINAVDRGVKTAEDFISKFEELNGVKFSDIGDGEFSVDNVARAIQINEDRKKQEVGSDFM